ncbi:hypothetical protein FRC14_007441 [Serendipita sp. 396]|nr:hypothetical protein FRC14_007441 [Serendipita sp. 396]
MPRFRLTTCMVSKCIQNPTIGALYPGKTTLNIVRNLDSSKALAPDVTSFGPTKSVYAQLWYEGEEEFFCTAENCDANDGDTSSDWTCHDLKCNCRTNATFCGAVPATSIKNVIDTLKGDLQIKCSNQDDGTISCSFLQETINSVFGSAGLPMSNCQLGECVAQSVIDSTTNPTSTAASSTKSELSGGVVAGLAVVGVLILGFMAMFLWGWIVQRKARQSAGSTTIKSGGVTLRWSAINYSVPTSHSGLFKKSKANAVGERHILNDLYGEVRPGELLAILGPSGAGKSTLIDILGGKNKVGKTTGTVTFSSVNGASIKKPRIGFVDQQDILPSMLTVEEALLFAAKLRLPESITLEQKQARVFEVMKQLNILDLKDTRIGSHERRGISGGEQRRVSIGLELVAAPDILVLDEPTSGLDSVSANKVVSVLRDLAHDPTNPTAVIASVHQPNSKIYQLFDKVLVLSRGKELYFGMGGLAPGDHFATRGHPIQPGYNVADHLLDIASDPSEDLLEKSQRTSGSPTINQVTSDGRHPTNQNYSKTMVNEIDGSTDPEKGKPKEIEESHQTMPLGSPYLLASYTSTFLTQLQVLCGREWKILKSPAAWLLSRFFFDVLPLRILPTIIVSTIVYWMAGLAPDAAHFFKFLFVLVLYTFAMTLFNFLLACTFRNGGIAILLSALFNLFIMTFAGFFVHLADIPQALRWLQWFSLLKYCLEALAVNEVGSGLQIVDTLQGVPVNVSAQLIMNLLFGFGENNYYRDILVLFAFIAGFGLALIGIVWLRVRERR